MDTLRLPWSNTSSNCLLLYLKHLPPVTGDDRVSKDDVVHVREVQSCKGVLEAEEEDTGREELGEGGGALCCVAVQKENTKSEIGKEGLDTSHHGLPLNEEDHGLPERRYQLADAVQLGSHPVHLRNLCDQTRGERSTAEGADIGDTALAADT